jgi:predicted transcriptional regulator
LLKQHKPKPNNLSRRERQIMDILYARERASGAEILAAMPDAPSYSALRAKLRVLEEKGYIKHEEESLRYVYRPVQPRDAARKGALRHMLTTFFGGSVEDAVAALLDLSSAKLSKDDLDRISRRIADARKEGAKS